MSCQCDAVLLRGKVAEVRQALLNQLKDGGRLVAIIDVNGVGKVYGWIRFAANFDCQALFDADAHLLPGFERVAEFVFLRLGLRSGLPAVTQRRLTGRFRT
ncbi:MAG: hypothetical protein AB7E81_20965 [Hyphomicrobiaceae bacterium]